MLPEVGMSQKFHGAIAPPVFIWKTPLFKVWLRPSVLCMVAIYVAGDIRLEGFFGHAVNYHAKRMCILGLVPVSSHIYNAIVGCLFS